MEVTLLHLLCILDIAMVIPQSLLTRVTVNLECQRNNSTTNILRYRVLYKGYIRGTGRYPL